MPGHGRPLSRSSQSRPFPPQTPPHLISALFVCFSGTTTLSDFPAVLQFVLLILIHKLLSHGSIQETHTGISQVPHVECTCMHRVSDPAELLGAYKRRDFSRAVQELASLPTLDAWTRAYPVEAETARRIEGQRPSSEKGKAAPAPVTAKPATAVGVVGPLPAMEKAS